jgi:hypothetical protein
MWMGMLEACESDSEVDQSPVTCVGMKTRSVTAPGHRTVIYSRYVQYRARDWTYNT